MGYIKSPFKSVVRPVKSSSVKGDFEWTRMHKRLHANEKALFSRSSLKL
jgi:hypothetical protein